MIEVWIGIAAVLVAVLALLHFIVSKKSDKEPAVENARNLPANREVSLVPLVGSTGTERAGLIFLKEIMTTVVPLNIAGYTRIIVSASPKK